MSEPRRSEQFDITPAERIVVIKPTKLQISSGIEVVEEKQPEIGEVVDFGGAGVDSDGDPKTFPVSMQIGDIIAYRKFGESAFYIGGEQVKFVSFDDILGVIKPKKKK